MSYIQLAVTAAIYELAGDREGALRALREALRAGYQKWEIERDPAFEKLRADPAYTAAMAGVSTSPGSL